MNPPRLRRRQALSNLAALLAGSPFLRAQHPPQLVGEPPGRATPLDEFASVPEFEWASQRKLGTEAFARIADGERGALDRITFRPRMMVNTEGLDLSLELFDQPLFAPILVGPAAGLQACHPEGERALAQGAAAANALVVTAERSGTPIAETAPLAREPWRQVYPDADLGALLDRVQRAIQAGCRAVCLTLGVRGAAPATYGWQEIERLRGAIDVPLVLKGVLRPAEAAAAAQRGVAGVVVSNHGAGRRAGTADPVAVLPAIADEVAGRIPVLVDGGFRHGGDVLKALALGATAVLVCRPALWGLAAYGAAGVQKVVEMLQTELAQDMAQVGAVNLAAIRRDHIRIHRR